jgi:hypothetical protein
VRPGVVLRSLAVHDDEVVLAGSPPEQLSGIAAGQLAGALP